MTNRLHAKSLALYISDTNVSYTLVDPAAWTFTKDSSGAVTIALNERKSARYVKIHVKFDDRQADYLPDKSRAEFLNTLARIMEVYLESTTLTEKYGCDLAGNRTRIKTTKILDDGSDDYDYSYYSHSDRLKSDGRFAYVYDRNGNLIQKGNRYTVNGDQVEFTQTSGDGVLYWEYSYDPLNRLKQVKKNTAAVCDYGYDPEGLRVWKKAGGKTTHYVFEGTEPIFEKQTDTGTGATIAIRSYVYVLGKHLARVDGTIGTSGVDVYFYHTDHLGSTKVVTDSEENNIWRADYLAFGRQFGQSGTFEDTHGFTGKEYDRETGLYYFGARYYDSEIGRFTRVDPSGWGLNLYAYCSNNPLKFTDPTGLREIIDGDPATGDMFTVIETDNGYVIVDGGEDYASIVDKAIANTLLTGDMKWISAHDNILSKGDPISLALALTNVGDKIAVAFDETYSDNKEYQQD